MSIKTMFRDDAKKQKREAWQNGKVVYQWKAIDIQRMHNEAPDTVPAFGRYLGDKPIPHDCWKIPFNAEITGG